MAQVELILRVLELAIREAVAVVGLLAEAAVVTIIVVVVVFRLLMEGLEGLTGVVVGVLVGRILLKAMAVLAQSASSGPAVLGYSHQHERLTNRINNGTLHTN